MSQWEMVKLGDVCKITSGGTPNRKHQEYFSGSIPWVKTGDLKQKYISTPEEFITELGVKNSAAKLFPKGTVLIALYGATIGACSILSIDATTNQACGAILPSEKILPEYLYLFLLSHKQVFISQGVGGAQPNISGSILKNTRIPLPPLDIQKQIVARLELAQAMIDQRKQQLGLMDALIQSTFFDMFYTEEKDKNEQIKNRFKMVDLMSVCEFITDGTHQTPQYCESDGVIFLSSKNVTSGKIDWDAIKYIPESLHNKIKRQFTPQVGDILLAKNGTTGVAALVDRSCIFSIYVSLAILRPKTDIILPKYLLAAINSPFSKRQFNAHLKGVGVQNLHLKDIRDCLISLPPLPLQQQFAERVEQIEELKAQMSESLAELEQNFNALMQQSFAG